MQLYIITTKRKLDTYATSWYEAKSIIRSFYAREDGETSDNLAKKWSSPRGNEYVTEIWEVNAKENYNMTDEMIEELEEEEAEKRGEAKE